MGNKKTTCMEYALYYLHRVPKTESELERKLLQKGYSEGDIHHTMRELKKTGLVDDVRFAELYFSSEAGRKGQPVFRVVGKLLQKGVEKNIIQAAKQKLEDEIEDGIHTKICREIEKYKEKGITGFDISIKLTQKGYTIPQIKRAIHKRDAHADHD